MNYDPLDHLPTTRQLIAAWIVCLGIAGLLGVTGRGWGVATAAATDPTEVATAPARCPMAGVRLPEFVPLPVDHARI